MRDVKDDHPVAQNETFGPVAPIISFESDNEAVKLATGVKIVATNNKGPTMSPMFSFLESHLPLSSVDMSFTLYHLTSCINLLYPPTSLIKKLCVF